MKTQTLVHEENDFTLKVCVSYEEKSRTPKHMTAQGPDGAKMAVYGEAEVVASNLAVTVTVMQKATGSKRPPYGKLPPGPPETSIEFTLSEGQCSTLQDVLDKLVPRHGYPRAPFPVG